MATLAQNIQRAIDDFNSIENAIVQKGVPVPEGTPTSEYGEKILSIETGVDTSEDTVVPSALREGYTAHDAAGQEITGTIPDYRGGNTVEMTSPDGATLNTAGTYCEGNIEVVPKLQSKTATTGEIVTADEGYSGLKEVDTNPVFEAGKKSENDAFWDAYQQNGARGNYAHAFAGHGWDDESFTPRYDIVPTSVYMLFASSNIKDVPACLERQGVTIDWSRCTDFLYLFLNNDITEHFGVIDTRAVDSIAQIMNNASAMRTIDKLIFRDDGSQNFSSSITSSIIYYCKALNNLTIEGTIGQNGFNVSWSPLSKASLTSIVNALSSTTTGLTVTLRLAAVNTAFETAAGAADGSTSDEWTALIATKPNWTINLINS